MSREEFEARYESVEKIKVDKLDDIVNLIHASGLRTTKADARRLINQGGLKLNGHNFSEIRPMTTDDLLFGKYLVLKAGKKRFAIIELI